MSLTSNFLICLDSILGHKSEHDSNFELEFRVFLNGRCTTQENIRMRVTKFVETFDGERNLKGLINFNHLVKDVDPRKNRRKTHFWSKIDEGAETPSTKSTASTACPSSTAEWRTLVA